MLDMVCWKSDSGSVRDGFGSALGPLVVLAAVSVGIGCANGRTDVIPTLTTDQLTVFFSSTRFGGLGMADIWTATRASSSAMFTTPVAVTELNGPTHDAAPSLAASGLEIYMASLRDGTWDIFVAERSLASGPFDPPMALAALNDPTWTDSDPAISADGATLYFATDRPGGPGTLDIWVTTRACSP